jgi:tRNA A-37 threonylcarbamoyl transferase component Bud32
MGVVYEAARDDEQYEQRVALKVVRRGVDTDFVRARFARERRILARLEHPNIARLIDGGATEDGRPYFVMERIEGESIRQYCQARQLSVVERLKLFRQVCAAVHYAHRHSVIHRDIKPGNILIGRDGAPKLLDFGIAKLLNRDGEPGIGFDSVDNAARTRTELRMMTPEYASPEQVRGTGVTAASDVYALGALLYELLTGQRPHRFGDYSMSEVERVICETDLAPPSVAAARDNGDPAIRSAEWRKQIVGDLDNIILMAMRKEPERRYQSVEAFSEDIRRHLEGLRVMARGDGFVYRAEKFIRTRKLTIAAALIVAVSITGAAVATAHVSQIARDERARAVRDLADARARNCEAEAQRSEAVRLRIEAEAQRDKALLQRSEAEHRRGLAEAERRRIERLLSQTAPKPSPHRFDFRDMIRTAPTSTEARRPNLRPAFGSRDCPTQLPNGGCQIAKEGK